MTNPPPANLPHLSPPPSGPSPSTSPPPPDNPSPNPLLSQKSNLPLWLGIGGLVVVLIAAGVYYLKSAQVLTQPPTNDQVEKIPSPTPPVPGEPSKPGELCGLCGGFAGFKCKGGLTCSLTDPADQSDRAGLCIPVPKLGQTINAKDFCATGALASPSATPTSLCQTDTDCPSGYTCLKELTYEQNQQVNTAPTDGLCIPTGPER